jgi:hypothetical protein
MRNSHRCHAMGVCVVSALFRLAKNVDEGLIAEDASAFPAGDFPDHRQPLKVGI